MSFEPSKRAIVLMNIFEYQKENPKGISYTELKKRTGLSDVAVSKSFDSLMDMGVIKDGLFEMEDGLWSKRILVCKCFWETAEKMHEEYTAIMTAKHMKIQGKLWQEFEEGKL